jgi:acyl-CoA thioester hydrolase
MARNIEQRGSDLLPSPGGLILKPATPVAETTFRVRYAETDRMGIVHHAAYVVWLEEGRSHYIRAQGRSYTQFEQEGISLAVSELHVRYGQAARYDQRVTVRCWVEEVKSRQVTFGYEVVVAETGDLLATACSKHICVNRQGKVTTIPARWRQLWDGAAGEDGDHEAATA